MWETVPRNLVRDNPSSKGFFSYTLRRHSQAIASRVDVQIQAYRHVLYTFEYTNPNMAVVQKSGTKMGCPGKW